jgi:hypothetical protein
MQDFAKLLRYRLGAKPEPQIHPDADLLSAYAEQALPASERLQIVEHLSACGACRELVALSLPMLEEHPVAWTPARKSGFWTLGFRWAAVAATVAIAGTLAVEKPWNHQGESLQSQSQSQLKTVQVASAPQPAVPAGSPTPPEVTQESAASASAAPAAGSDQQAFSERRSDVNALPALGDMVARRETASAANDSKKREESARVVGTRDRAPLAELSAARADMQAASAKPAMMAGPAPVQVAGMAAPIKNIPVQTFTPSNPDYVNLNRFANGAAAGGQQPGEVIAQSAMVTVRPGQSANLNGEMRKAFAPAISSDRIGATAYSVTADATMQASAPAPPAASGGKQSGLLGKVFTYPRRMMEGAEKSSGSGFNGFTSDHVTFNPNAIASQGLGSSSLHWRVSSDGRLMNSPDLTQWHEAYPQDQFLRFKVVVSEGHEIWAGGSSLTLIHSWNGGQNWKKLDLGAAGPGSTGDITDISIDDGNVQVKTSNGQTLVSHDHGVTWVPLQQNAPK